jgi:hypothetical protein
MGKPILRRFARNGQDARAMSLSFFETAPRNNVEMPDI